MEPFIKVHFTFLDYSSKLDFCKLHTVFFQDIVLNIEASGQSSRFPESAFSGKINFIEPKRYWNIKFRTFGFQSNNDNFPISIFPYFYGMCTNFKPNSVIKIKTQLIYSCGQIDFLVKMA